MDFAALAARLPEWGRIFDGQKYAAFLEAVHSVLDERAEAYELHDEFARIAGSDVPLLPLAQLCSSAPQAEWRECVRRGLEERLAADKLGRELDELRGDFARARPRLKMRLQTSPAIVSAELAGGVHAALVLDLPSFITPVRQADLAAWERPASELVALALENVKAQEQVELKPMEIAGTRVFGVSGQGPFVASLVLAADELLGEPTPFGVLVAVPSAHILLCHSLVDRRSLRALEAMAAGALQAFESGPSPLVPHLFWKRGDRFVTLPVRRSEEGKAQCDLPREFDEQVVEKL
ncbi:MAG: hypothetical protein E6J78_07495 [Deltaproteobacteria bacterium]|nr:MAG: hypothetical protein E6J78_07495 [Deltaproteobacteria bacterium]